VGVAARQLEEAARSRPWPVQVVAEPEQADVLLSLRGQLGRDPELRRRARSLGLPILVIKSDTLHQLQRAIERLLERREECRLAVEKVVLPQAGPWSCCPAVSGCAPCRRSW